MSTLDRNTIIQQIKKVKEEVVPESKLILFGSQARGDAGPDSDWDLLILVDKDVLSPSDFDRLAYPFVRVGWDFGAYFSMKLYTLSEWMKREGTLFFKNVEAEGIEL
ncbi:MAG TPA: nucleotidyltransferase domain-containing protein [Porphyromonadaceae bacterium]|jgi:predicted nucleotidyltransferase|uniref:nucleotidyltransferase domain-containing protein n=1 Tax=Limibacterium fermenti TaxID=3229863 RepID=UPI000E88DD25|nr:nucleotidyltransferase domain-containing protein [Porphyromonadaceae bacterium]